MRNYYLFLIPAFLGFTTKTLGQTTEYLDSGYIKARVNASGDQFNSPSGVGFEAPAGSGKQTLEGTNLWVGAQDYNGNLYTAVHNSAKNIKGFWPGPVANTYSATYDARYNRVWKISKAEILAHQVNFNQVGYVTPPVILQWPGNGDAANGEASVLAPYADVDGNGHYSPEGGDHPVIPGDQAIFFIMNDTRGTKQPASQAMGLEVHGMAYSSGNYQEVFLNYTIFNRSGTNYHDMYLGIWNDFDIGNKLDDYVGSDAAQSLFFAYNGDNFDDGLTGYGAGAPALGTAFLNFPMSSFISFQNDGSVMGNPTDPEHFYYYLQGKWKDGQFMRYGANGYTNGNGAPNTRTRYMYSASTDSVFSNYSSWTEESENNPPGDRTGLGSIGPFSFSAGESQCVALAYVYAKSSNPLTSRSLLKALMPGVKNFWSTNFGTSCTNSLVLGQPAGSVPTAQLKVYPNPAINQLYVQVIESAVSANTSGQLFDLTGKEISTAAFSYNEGTLVFSIDKLMPGVYFLQIRSGDQVLNAKFIKQ